MQTLMLITPNTSIEPIVVLCDPAQAIVVLCNLRPAIVVSCDLQQAIDIWYKVEHAMVLCVTCNPFIVVL